jgi:TRAP-type C4-dicarboxylate transport system permease large subunit
LLLLKQHLQNIILLTLILLLRGVKQGVHPLYFEFIVIVNVTIGLTTPPPGACFLKAAPIPPRLAGFL